jgi:hypothetical protein
VTALDAKWLDQDNAHPATCDRPYDRIGLSLHDRLG